MRLGRFNEARDAFLRGLAAAEELPSPGQDGRPPGADCDENLRVLDSHLTATGANLAASTATSRYATLARWTAEAAQQFNAIAAARTPGFEAENPSADETGGAHKSARRRRRCGNGLTPVASLQHTVRELPRVHISRLYTDPVNARYARGAAPFILTGLPESPGWRARPASANALSLWSGGGAARFLRAAFPDATVDFYGGNMGYVAVTPRYTRMSAALDELEKPLPKPACLEDDDDDVHSAGHQHQHQHQHQQQGRPRGVITRPGRYLQWNADAAQWKRLQQYLGPLPPLFTGDAHWLDSGACFTDLQPQPVNHTIPSSGGGADGDGSEPQQTEQKGQKQQQQQQQELLRLRSEFQVWTHWRMLLVGSEGAGMFNHADTLHTGSWQLQIAGAKTWHLCAPEQGPYMGSAGEVDTLAPDYAASPFFKAAQCFRDTVRPGEAIFYPSDWWHQTYNHADAAYREGSIDADADTDAAADGAVDDKRAGAGLSVAITGSVVDASNFRAVREQLRKEMQQSNSAKRRLIPITPALSHALEGMCFALWDDLYGPWPQLQPKLASASASAASMDDAQ